jgi:hypothetical protein
MISQWYFKGITRYHRILDTLNYYKGHFTLRLLVEWTRDSSNLIGGEPKFVHLAFTLEVNGQMDKRLQDIYMATLFGSFGTKSLSA